MLLTRNYKYINEEKFKTKWFPTILCFQNSKYFIKTVNSSKTDKFTS